MVTEKSVVTAQHSAQAHGPKDVKSRSTAASRGRPKAAARRYPLSLSRMKVPGVVVLKPKRASSTNVLYIENGRPSSSEPMKSREKKTSPVRMSLSPKRARRSARGKPPARMKVRVAAVPTVCAAMSHAPRARA